MYQSLTVKPVVVLLLIQVSAEVVKCSFDPFMDSKIFTIKWQGHLDLDTKEVDTLGDRHMLITTNHQEHYRCILPETLKSSENDDSSYVGLSVEELMRPLFQQSYCSYRIESYWTYELCHGKHLKQYHEAKEQGKEPKLQEYYLGYGQQEALKESQSTSSDAKVSIPVRAVDGIELPYFEVVMGDGTKCDLTGKPRKAHILYVCQPEGMGEVYELKESSTCEYEVVVLSSNLCKHPKYRPKIKPVNEIRCHAMIGSPLKPMELSQAEIDARYLQEAGQDYVVQEATPEGETAKRKPKLFRRAEQEGEQEQPNVHHDTQSKLGTLTDKQTLRSIMNGDQCLSGGTGWWKHEVCFWKFVKQFHVEEGHATNVYLGYWDKDKHIEWLKDNPSKRPRLPEVRKYISLYYSNGEVCDLTGKPRNCEVRLKCLSNVKNPHAVILSLVEPESCSYILTVESALFCPILKDADDNGLFDHLEL